MTKLPRTDVLSISGRRLLRRKDVEARTGLARATIYRFIAEGMSQDPAVSMRLLDVSRRWRRHIGAEPDVSHDVSGTLASPGRLETPTELSTARATFKPNWGFLARWTFGHR